MTTTALQKATGATARQLWHWTVKGWVHPGKKKGNARNCWWSQQEIERAAWLRTIARKAKLTRMGRIAPIVRKRGFRPDAEYLVWQTTGEWWHCFDDLELVTTVQNAKGAVIVFARPRFVTERS